MTPRRRWGLPRWLRAKIKQDISSRISDNIRTSMLECDVLTTVAFLRLRFPDDHLMKSGGRKTLPCYGITFLLTKAEERETAI